MVCKVCGRELDASETICPYCGADQTVEPEAEAVEPEAETVEPEAEAEEPEAETVEPEAEAEEPEAEAVEPEAETEEPEVEEEDENPIITGEVRTEDTDTREKKRKKKKEKKEKPHKEKDPVRQKHVWRTVIIILVVVVLLIVVIGIGLFINTYSKVLRAKSNAEDFWTAFEEQSVVDLLEDIPDAYWDYIEDEYGYDEGDIEVAMDYYLETLETELGGNLTVDWVEGDVDGGKAGAEAIEDAEYYTDAFGLDITYAAGVETDATITGDEDSADFDYNTWVVKIDGDWYDLTAMILVNQICASDYVESAINNSVYGDAVETFWTAFYSSDGETMGMMMPDTLWDALYSTYGVDQEGAEACIETYADAVKEYAEIDDGETYEFEVSVTEVSDYDEEDMEEINESLDESLISDTYLEVDFDYALTMDGEVVDSSSSSAIMMLLDDEWVLFDGVYYFINACYYYAA